MMSQHKEKGKLRNGKGETSAGQKLQEAQDEYNEVARLCVFRVKSLKEGQFRSLLTQATRHHAAQVPFTFREQQIMGDHGNSASLMRDMSKKSSSSVAGTSEGHAHGHGYGIEEFDGCTLLYLACETVDVGMIELLLQYGANINVFSSRGRHHFIIESLVAKLHVQSCFLQDPFLGLKQRSLVTDAARALEKAKMMRITANHVQTQTSINRTHRWKRVHHSLIEAIEDMLSSYGKVFLQTDIEAVLLRMKQQSLIMAMGSLPLITKKNDSWKTFLELSQIENNTFWDVGLQSQSQAKCPAVIVKLKEQIKTLKGNVDDSKVKMDMDEIETLNIELEHRVTKLVAENEHLKQTYKQLYDSIKPKRVQSKEQCDSDQGLVIAALKNELRKLKGKTLDKEAIETHSVDPKVSKDNMEPITPKLLNKRTAHSSYIKHTQEEALVLKDIDLFPHKFRTCPSINNFDPQLVAVTPRKKDKKVRVRYSTMCSGHPSGNTRNDKILQTPSSNSKNKVEAHPRNVKSSLNKRNGIVKVNGSASVQNSKKHDNSDYVCINGDDCMSSDNLCVSNSMNDVPSRKPIVLESESPKPVVNLVYSRKPRKNKNTESVSKTEVVQIVLWYLDSGCSKHMTRDRSQLTNFISKFLGTVKFGNDQVAKIMGYGDYQIGNVTISRVYYVEGLGHNLFSVGQFCDSNLEVAFRQHTCFIRNLEGVDLLTGSRGDNLYTLSLGNMMASSPICLLSKASKTKSWLWHHRLSHLNFAAINHLARHRLVRGLPMLKFEKDHLCSACL
ncbi:retrovirus-related pol polyprotein from transposon TNT 1-94 [Tanacetum coccineum]